MKQRAFRPIRVRLSGIDYQLDPDGAVYALWGATRRRVHDAQIRAEVYLAVKRQREAKRAAAERAAAIESGEPRPVPPHSSGRTPSNVGALLRGSVDG